MMKILFKESGCTFMKNFVFCVMLTFSGGYASAAENDFAGGSGTEKEPYLVETAEHLDNVRNHLNAHFKQTADIDLSGFSKGAGWEPIACDDAVLEGTFNGNGYEIAGLTINRASTNGVGLFKGLGRKSMVENVTLVNVEITGNNITGGLAGGGTGNIENVSVTGEITGGGFTGGLVGISDGEVFIKACSFQGKIKGLQYVGGLLGASVFPMGSMADDVPDKHPSVKACSAQGRIIGKEFTGGLIGTNGGEISKSWFSGRVEGEKKTGGLVGHNEDGNIAESCSGGQVAGKNLAGGLVGENTGKIRDSYARAYVEAERGAGGLVVVNRGSIKHTYAACFIDGEKNKGGLAVHDDGQISNSYYDTKTAGKQDRLQGLSRTSEQMKQRKTFENWDFENVWTIDEGDTYPFFRWQAKKRAEMPAIEASEIREVTGKQKPSTDISGEFAGGSGTQEDPFLVGTAQQLNNVRDYLDKHFKQIADIDLADYADGRGWEPIGYFGLSNSFTGTFDGNGYEIVNLTIDRPKKWLQRGLESERNQPGLFGQVGNGGMVRYVKVKKMDIVGIQLIGGIAGSVSHGGEIKNCYASGKIEGVTIEAGKMGGLVGFNSGKITQSSASVEVQGQFNVGGLVGINYEKGVVKNSYSIGKIRREEAKRSGGFVGTNYGNIIHCYAAVAFDVEKMPEKEVLGGFVALSEKNYREESKEPEIENCYYDKDIAGLDDTIGGSIPRTTEQMKQRETFEDWDFEDVWTIDEDESYPSLQWEQGKTR